MSAAEIQAECLRDSVLIEFLEALVHQVLFLRAVRLQ